MHSCLSLFTFLLNVCAHLILLQIMVLSWPDILGAVCDIWYCPGHSCVLSMLHYTCMIILSSALSWGYLEFRSSPYSLIFSIGYSLFVLVFTLAHISHLVNQVLWYNNIYDLFQPKTSTFSTSALIWAHFTTVHYCSQTILCLFSYLKMHNTI